MSIFNKVLIFSDAHFGRGGNSIIANKDNIDFIKWAIDEAKTFGAEQCFMLGDWFDNRHTIGNETLSFALKGLELLSEAFKQSWFISGNHDMFYRTKRDVTSIEFAKHIPNIKIINDPFTVEDCTFLPWLMPDEHKTLDIKSRYVFSHLELPNFLMNSKVELPETEESVDIKIFDAAEYCFTGHFHWRQVKKNIFYIGNLMPFNYSDEGDSDRGIMLLEYGKEPIFHKWPGQPLYRSVKLSELVAAPDKILKQNMSLRVSIDLPLRYEEADEIREALIKEYSLRKIELINGTIEEQDFVDKNVQFRTIDQIVTEGLGAVDSVELSNKRLIEIYLSLAS